MSEPAPPSEARQLTRERIVTAALELLDQEGVSALSMRRLADNLGVGTMSLYHYVADKQALTEAVIERVMAEVHWPQADEPWRDMARAVATSYRAAALAHPSAMGLLLSRPPPASTMERWIQVHGVLRRTGLSDQQARRSFNAVARFVVGWSLAEVAEVRDRSGRGRVPPREVRDEDFAFTLDALLDGLASRFARGPGVSHRPEP